MEVGANQYGAAAVASDARLADWRKVRRVVFEDIRFFVGGGQENCCSSKVPGSWSGNLP